MKKKKLQTNKDLARVCQDFAAAISAATLYDRTVGSAVSQQGGKRERQTGGIFFFAGERARGVATRDIGR